MAQEEDLGVLGAVGAGEQGKPAEYAEHPAPDLVVSTAFAVLTPVSVGPSFLYGITERPDFAASLASVAEGTAYPAVRPEQFLQAPLPLPPWDAIASFEVSTTPLRRRAGAALKESRKLAALRDTLLPPLLSGELCVGDAEILVRDASSKGSTMALTDYRDRAGQADDAGIGN